MTILASGLHPGYQIALDSNFVYATTNGGAVAKITRTGTIVTLGSGTGVANNVCVDSTTIYWSNSVSSGHDEIHSIPIVGGSQSIIINTITAIGSIFADGTNVYWTDAGTGGSTGSVKQMPKAGGTVTTLASSQNIQASSNSLWVDSTNVYWTTNGGALIQIPIGGGSQTPLNGPFTGVSPNTFFCSAPVSDGVNVYFVDLTVSGRICKIPIGGGAVTVLASGFNIPVSLSVDDSNCYWTDQGDNTVYRVSKNGGSATLITTIPGGRPAVQLGGIAADGTGVYFAGIAAHDIYREVLPWQVAIVSDSSFTADLTVDVSLDASVTADSKLNEYDIFLIAMVEDQADERMFILDSLRPALHVFNTASITGGNPPLQLRLQPLTIIVLTGLFAPGERLLHKLQFDPLTLSVWVVGDQGTVLCVNVDNQGNLTGFAPTIVPGTPLDFVVSTDPAVPSNAYCYVATDVATHELNVIRTTNNNVFNYDYQSPTFLGGPGNPSLELQRLDTGQGNLLSAVWYDSSIPNFTFGGINQGAAPTNAGMEAFTQTGVSTVDGLSTVITTENVTGVPYASNFDGSPPSYFITNGTFPTTSFGSNPATALFPGFLGPQTQFFVADDTGVLYTTPDGTISFSTVTTFPHPVTVLEGDVNHSAYPFSDQQGMWAVAQQNNGKAHLYRYSFQSSTLIDIPFPATPPIAGVSATAICLDEAAATVYVLDQQAGFPSPARIWVIDAVAGTVTKSIDLSGIQTLTNLLNYGSLQVHNNTLWLMKSGAALGYGTSLMSPCELYSVDATTGSITTFNKTSDTGSFFTAMIQSGGQLTIPSLQFTFLVISDGTGASIDGTFTIITDTNVDFVAAGVTTSDFYVRQEFNNPHHAIVSVSTHQIVLAIPDDPAGPSLGYLIVSTGSSSQMVLAIYDATTGVGSATSIPIPTTAVDDQLAFLAANRQTSDVFSVQFSTNQLYQITGSSVTAAPVTISPDVQAFQTVSALTSGNDGHIHIATLVGSTPNGAIVTFQNITDAAPSTSNPWPVPASFALGIDTVGSDTYAVDSIQGLYLMSGDGPFIGLVDPTIQPIVPDPTGVNVTTGLFNNFNTTIIGDDINNGLWLLYTDHVVFWDIGTQTTKYYIPLIGASAVHDDLVAALNGDSSISAPLSLRVRFNAALSAGASVSANVQSVRRMIANLTANSSLNAPQLTEITFLQGSLLCSSSMIGNLTVRDQESIFAVGDSLCMKHSGSSASYTLLDSFTELTGNSMLTASLTKGDTAICADSDLSCWLSVIPLHYLLITGLFGLGPIVVNFFITISGAANSANNGTFLIVEWLSSGAIRIFNPHPGATPFDVNNGHISWFISSGAFVHYVISTNVSGSTTLAGAASVTGNMTQNFRRHGVGTGGGNSEAHGSARLASSHRNFNNGNANAGQGAFQTPVGPRNELPPAPGSKQPHLRIRKNSTD